MFNYLSIIHKFASLGLSFIALISFLSNCIPYLTIPYLAFIFIYVSSTHANTLLTTATIVVSSAFAALGKVVVYYIGRGVGRIMFKNVNREVIELFNRLMDKGIFLAIFLFAASPLPDDVLYIPVGVLKYSPIKFFIACFMGKIVITSIVALSGEFINFVMSPVYATILSIVVTIIVLLLMRKIDWETLVKNLIEKGIFRTLFDIIRNPLKFVKR